jgi:uncharacterized protein (DUF488 family)
MLTLRRLSLIPQWASVRLNLGALVRDLAVSWMPQEVPCLFTIGYEGLTVPEFVHHLRDNGIRLLVDVRHNPISRKPGFSKAALSRELARNGISYEHLPELGVPSAKRRNLGSPASYESLFRYYERRVLAANRASVDQIVSLTRRFSRIALMCFEADPEACHRHKITESLLRDSSFRASITHLP